MDKFVTDVLEKAATGKDPYRNIDSATMKKAQKVLDEYESNPYNVSGNVIGVDLQNGIIRISRWER